MSGWDILGGLERRLRNGVIDEFVDDFVIKPVIVGRFADHLELLIELSDVDPRLMFGLRLKNRFVNQVSVLANQYFLKIIVFKTQIGLPVKWISVRDPILGPAPSMNKK